LALARPGVDGNFPRELRLKGAGGPHHGGDVGEWGLLKKTVASLSRTLSKRVVLGPGDDAALVRLGHDVQVRSRRICWWKGFIFGRRGAPGPDLGHKTLAVNLSDLAAMGDVEPTVGVLVGGNSAGDAGVLHRADFLKD
jgi:hypothetical protein